MTGEGIPGDIAGRIQLYGDNGMKLYTRAFIFPRIGYYINRNVATGIYEVYGDGIPFTKLDSVVVE